MNCFNHPDIPAVGICKYCQRGLCKDCAIDSGCGIACKYHQENVRTLTNIQAEIQIDGKRTLQNTEMLIRGMSAVFLGIFFILEGYFRGTYNLAAVLTFLFLFMISSLAVVKNLRNK
jgi:hypothetical protein